MIDLDERLDRAGTAVRSQINSIPVRSPGEVVQRQRRSRIMTLAYGFAAVAVLIFASSFIFEGGANVLAGQLANPVPAHTYTVDLPGWDLISVGESEDGSGRTHTLSDDNSTTGELRRVRIETGSIAIERGETLRERGIEPIDSIFLNESTASLYRTQSDAELGWATVIATWTGPQDEQVAILFFDVGLNEARELLTGLTPLDLEEWESLTSGYEPPVTTTISG